MDTRTLLLDLAIGVAAGYAATKATECIQPVLFRLTPGAVRRHEESVRPGPPSQVAVRQIAKHAGVALHGKWFTRAASALHCGTGLAWGTMYGLLRRLSGIGPWRSALLTGAAMSLVVDEGLSPALGFSAPNREYPLATHVRGMMTHLLFGLALAASAEALYHLAPSRLRLS